MNDLNDLRQRRHKTLSDLEHFEECCLGQAKLTPHEYRLLNEELSISAVLHIGSYRLDKRGTDTHLVWCAPDDEEYDLGSVQKMDVMHQYPGFSRMRTLALGHEKVMETKRIETENGNHLSMVEMMDGSIGYGPNYKIALRNAALKMHLKNQFEKANPKGIWKIFYGRA